MSGLCETCKHWKRRHWYDQHGTCALAEGGDHTGAFVEDGAAKVEEHVIDPKWQQGASLVTHRRFGCVRHEVASG